MIRGASRPDGLVRGEIHYGYHDFILDSSEQWGNYMSHLTMVDRFNDNFRLERKVFSAWKRDSWWRILRVRYGKKCLKNWRGLVLNTKEKRRTEAKAVKFFVAIGMRRGWSAWKESTQRRGVVKRKASMTKGKERWKIAGAKRGMKTWAKFGKRQAAVRDGAAKLERLWRVGLLLLPVFKALREHALKEIHSGFYMVGVRNFMKNVDERRRLRNLYNMAWAKSELLALMRGLNKFKRYAKSRKDFR